MAKRLMSKFTLKIIDKAIDIIFGDGEGFWCWAEEKTKAQHLWDNVYLVNGLECRRCFVSATGPYGEPNHEPVKRLKDAYLSRSICNRICSNTSRCWNVS